MNAPDRRPVLSVLLAAFLFLSGPLYADDSMIPAPVLENGQQPVETILFPTGDLFRPLLADLKEPRFYFSYRRYNYDDDNIDGFAGGYGEIFGLYRKMDRDKGTSWQISFGGGIHSQFNLDAPSFALVNTDFTVGFPFAWRKGRDSYRLALYHQSSHLGDEFLLQTKANRLEFSYEAINFIASREWAEWRGYAGGEYLVHRVPDLRPLQVQAGVEYYGKSRVLGRGRPVGGLDLKVNQEQDWGTVNTSVKAGLQFDGTAPNGRFIRVLLEGYRGFAPHGQFYTSRIGFYGFGAVLGFE
jgi:hypothetical protein